MNFPLPADFIISPQPAASIIASLGEICSFSLIIYVSSEGSWQGCFQSFSLQTFKFIIYPAKPLLWHPFYLTILLLKHICHWLLQSSKSLSTLFNYLLHSTWITANIWVIISRQKHYTRPYRFLIYSTSVTVLYFSFDFYNPAWGFISSIISTS